MNVIDSSAWLEYFADGPNASKFARPIEKVRELIVPTISILEVFKKVMGQAGEEPALQVVAVMQQGTVVDLDLSISLASAKLSLDLKIPLADSIILATARSYNATLWTQDSDFKGIKGVKFFGKSK